MKKPLFIAAATVLLVTILSVLLYAVYWVGCFDLVSGLLCAVPVLFTALLYYWVIRYFIRRYSV